MKELTNWLKDLLVPQQGEFLYVDSKHDWSSHGDGTIHSIVLNCGKDNYSAISEAYRVLKPGGHLALMSPDEEPTGHSGACYAEEMGFEVRDSILMLSLPDGFVYSGKTTTKEREEGCYLVEEKKFAISGGANKAMGREEGYSAAQSIGLNRVSKRRNIHPTVKPRVVMQYLLSDVDKKSGPVVDPFMGSGTTGLACLRTGHDFIGIEREEEYAKIADSRIRHWTNAEEAWNPVIVNSEVGPEAESTEVQEVSFEDFLGI